MRCPTCGLINPNEALMCDCGHEFAAEAAQGTQVADYERRPGDGFRAKLAKLLTEGVRSIDGHGCLISGGHRGQSSVTWVAR